MTIDPFWAGVVSTLFVEMATIFVISILRTMRRK